MDRYEGPLTNLSIVFYRDLYINILIERYEGSHTALTTA
jgi:hypothetical protein